MSWTISARPDAIPATRVEARHLVQALQAGCDIAAARSIALAVGRIHVPLQALATVEKSAGTDDCIFCVGDFSRWDGLGFGLKSGQLIVEGDTGARTAAELVGGTVEIHGNCGAWAGAAMSGGRLIVHGETGDWLGANWPGELRGMTGGEIFVHGRARHHVGVRMRRGTIAVAGPVGEGAGRGMIAGSILLAGFTQGIVGQGMKRGTIVLGPYADCRTSISATGFPEADCFRPHTLGIQLSHAAAAGWKPAGAMLCCRSVRRYLGDRLNHGLGEILVLSDSAEGATAYT
ncbi:formylmethanofuran dehydrogenase subunit C [bacterium]|nr:formylmethanofuran dehydrogenase subunit C [bacterium]